jgi:hypothetical protein
MSRWNTEVFLRRFLTGFYPAGGCGTRRICINNFEELCNEAKRNGVILTFLISSLRTQFVPLQAILFCAVLTVMRETTFRWRYA